MPQLGFSAASRSTAEGPTTPGGQAGVAGEEIESFLRPSVTTAVSAKVLPTQRLLLPKGAFLDCTLETAIDSSLPGMTTCVLATDTYVCYELGRDGFVSRYSTADTDDGLSGDEGQFLACSFWLVSALAKNGRVEEARALFERLLGLANDLGLLAEEYDVPRRRQVGNFPQAFSHLTLIGAAIAISAADAGRTAAS